MFSRNNAISLPLYKTYPIKFTSTRTYDYLLVDRYVEDLFDSLSNFKLFGFIYSHLTFLTNDSIAIYLYSYKKPYLKIKRHELNPFLKQRNAYNYKTKISKYTGLTPLQKLRKLEYLPLQFKTVFKSSPFSQMGTEALQRPVLTFPKTADSSTLTRAPIFLTGFQRLYSYFNIHSRQAYVSLRLYKKQRPFTFNYDIVEQLRRRKLFHYNFQALLPSDFASTKMSTGYSKPLESGKKALLIKNSFTLFKATSISTLLSKPMSLTTVFKPVERMRATTVFLSNVQDRFKLRQYRTRLLYLKLYATRNLFKSINRHHKQNKIKFLKRSLQNSDRQLGNKFSLFGYIHTLPLFKHHRGIRGNPLLKAATRTMPRDSVVFSKHSPQNWKTNSQIMYHNITKPRATSVPKFGNYRSKLWQKPRLQSRFRGHWRKSQQHFKPRRRKFRKPKPNIVTLNKKYIAQTIYHKLRYNMYLTYIISTYFSYQTLTKFPINFFIYKLQFHGTFLKEKISDWWALLRINFLRYRYSLKFANLTNYNVFSPKEAITSLQNLSVVSRNCFGTNVYYLNRKTLSLFSPSRLFSGIGLYTVTSKTNWISIPNWLQSLRQPSKSAVFTTLKALTLTFPRFRNSVKWRRRYKQHRKTLVHQLLLKFQSIKLLSFLNTYVIDIKRNYFKLFAKYPTISFRFLKKYSITSSISVRFFIFLLLANKPFFRALQIWKTTFITPERDYTRIFKTKLTGYRLLCNGKLTKKPRASTQRFDFGRLGLSSVLNYLDSYSAEVSLKYGRCNIHLILNRRKTLYYKNYNFYLIKTSRC